MSSPLRAPASGLVLRSAVLLSCALVLGGCSTVKGWFGGKKEKPNEPAELTDFTPSVTVNKIWSEHAGKGEGRMGVRQGPAVADGRVYAAAIEGGVRALDLQTGKPVWHYESKRQLSGGPGAGDGLVVVGGLEGEVIALDAATGTEKWQAKVPAEVIAAPTIGLGSVFVRSNDGHVTAFDAATGERRWFWVYEVPTLSLRGNDAVVLGPGYVFSGNDDGTVSALSATDGRTLWTLPIAQQEGRSELDRLADVDGTPVLEGSTLYATSFKKQTVAIDAPSGRGMWASQFGGSGRLGVASDRLIVSDPAGSVYALDRNTGGSLWQQPALARRLLTSPAVQGDYAVVGDYDGYLHWMKLDTGELAARARVGGDALRGTPVVADGILVAQDIDGELAAFRLGQ
ncbi:outer membrane protein assembly factor BamB [Lysobacter solisilvae (ex Woo and Kim 2020)]|uniref:Outer membrane protein assembly factor BamB n=1 Tax=Agrilutibacter terrestris TaxID=2865112 RepID=A0A7H0FX92_9GAMM|nr:outer membrane protein assembly factor BamB [Lysobacter terrestris]QNP40658.1 outer membrane protein assembly factor BamB [Lysobacter terrestris]